MEILDIFSKSSIYGFVPVVFSAGHPPLLPGGHRQLLLWHLLRHEHGLQLELCLVAGTPPPSEGGVYQNGVQPPSTEDFWEDF